MFATSHRRTLLRAGAVGLAAAGAFGTDPDIPASSIDTTTSFQNSSG